MNILRIVSIILISVTFSLPSTFASEQLLVEIYKEYKTGNYPAALEKLDKVFGDKQLMGTRFYMAGLCHNRLENYESAIQNFKKAAGLKNPSKDLFYEYAQALYANNQLELSIAGFNKSVKLGFKVPSSLYYIAYSLQILEKFKQSNEYYNKLLQDDRTDSNMRQIARLYIAENYLKMAKNKPDATQIVYKYALPQMDKAIAEDEHSTLADDIDRRKSEVINLFKLNPNILANGKNIGYKRWNFSFTEKFTYDNNITFSSDQPSTVASQKDSYISKSTMYMDLNIPIFKKILFNPAITLEKIHHTRRENAEVLVNDENSIKGAMNLSYEHVFDGKPASLKFNYDYEYTERDRNATEIKLFTNRESTFGLSETLTYFKFGETNFGISQKTLTSYDSDLNSTTNSFTLTQYYILQSGNLMLATGGIDLLTVEDDDNSTDSLYGSLLFIIPNINRDYTLTTMLTMVFLDPKKQKPTRGLEKTYTPGITLSKKANHNTNISISYEYTKNTSKDKNFIYEKHVSGFEFSFSF